jgi:hypothetical protein
MSTKIEIDFFGWFTQFTDAAPLLERDKSISLVEEYGG